MDKDLAKLRTRWHYLVCASFILFMELGVLKSYGVLMNDLVRDLETHTWVIGLAAGLSHGIQAILAIVNTPLLRRFSFRQLIMTGSVISSLGFILSSFSQTGLQFVAASIISGLGNTLVVYPAQSCPFEYFPNHIAVASSIIMTGGGVGIMSLPILTECFITIYGWRGAVALIGALSLHSVVCGALLKPIDRHSIVTKTNDIEDGETDSLLTRAPLKLIKEHRHKMDADGVGEDETVFLHRDTNVRPLKGASDVTKNIRIENDRTGSKGEASLNTDMLSKDRVRECEAESLVCSALMNPPKGIFAPYSNGPRNDEIKPDSYVDIQDAERDPHIDSPMREERSDSSPFSECDCNFMKEKVRELLESISHTFDFRLLLDYPRMNSVLLTFLLFAISYNGWIVFLIPNCIAKGYTPSEAVFLATSGGLANILGRLLIGLFSSKQFIPDEILYCLVTTTEAVAFFANNLAYTFAVLTLLSVVNGFCCGARVVMENLLSKSSVPAERVMAAMTFIFLMFGIGEIAGGFLMGLIFDLTGSFNASFTVCGVVDLAAVLVLLIPWLCSIYS